VVPDLSRAQDLLSALVTEIIQTAGDQTARQTVPVLDEVRAALLAV
jgi:hypothetical protein